MKNKKRIIIVAAIILVIAFFVISGLNSSSSSTPVYTTAEVTKGDITSSVTASGTLIASKVQYGGFRVPGRIAEINVKQGDTVKAGQQLAKLDVTDLQNALSKAQYNFNAAVYKRDQTSSAPGADANAVKQAQQQVNTTWIDVQTAQNNLNNAVLVSNYDGVVAQVNGNIGDNVQATGNTSAITGQTSAVVTVIDETSYQVQMSISEGDIAQVKQDQSVTVTFDAIPDKSFTGKVTSVDLLGTTVSNVVSYSAKATIENLDPQVKVGMGANIAISIDSRKDVLLVPNSAVKKANGERTVQVMRNGIPESVKVEIGLSNDTQTEITSGLNQGDTIVIAVTTKTVSNNQFSNPFGGTVNRGTSSSTSSTTK